jgi:hypothetical protein
MLSHAVGSTARGAIGLLVASADAETPAMVSSEGPRYTPEEMAEIDELMLDDSNDRADLLPEVPSIPISQYGDPVASRRAPPSLRRQP